MCRYIEWNRIVQCDSRSELVHIFGIHVWHFGLRHEVWYAVEPFVYIFTVNVCRVYLKYTHTTATPLNCCKMHFVNECIPLLYRKYTVDCVRAEKSREEKRRDRRIILWAWYAFATKSNKDKLTYRAMATTASASIFVLPFRETKAKQFDKTKHGHELISRILFSAKCLHKQTIDCQMILLVGCDGFCCFCCCWANWNDNEIGSKYG